jgi:hypothetical protein
MNYGMINSCGGRRLPYSIGIALVLVTCMFLSPAFAAKAVRQETFTSPDEAATALFNAVKLEKKGALLAIFGKGSEAIVSSGDKVADRNARERFVKDYQEANKLEEKGPGKRILVLGNDGWPFPIPIVEKGNRWFFDTNAGKTEILNRRIGRNEMAVINVCETYVEAQREYASKDRNGDGILEFAQKIASDKGQKNGLYWKADEGGEQSPFGPLAAQAVSEGYGRKGKTGKTGKPAPFHGYFFKVLTV